MAVDLGAHLASVRDQLRVVPTPRRVRAARGGTPVLDSTDVLVVWEPRRVVAQYAVPESDMLVPLVPTVLPPPPVDLPPVLLPSHPFGWHLSPGQALAVRVDGETFDAAFRPDDPDLGGRVVVDWAPFDWTEEDQSVTGHPHDPFHRIDTVRSDRHVVVRVGDTVLADSRRPVALLETSLPLRWYLPREDVATEHLVPSDSRTVCAYKGWATYHSLPPELGGVADVAWSYDEPLRDASEVPGFLCFDDSKVTVES
ncbi:DUF427 domain-containing protein [Isoptericola sp. b441]|uniref:DUF427 domain-containing protein n=1 Tax=Actinotalea lenta TaxID=3064654 RepID=A0ABT9D5I5_9CELL|nr:DUF427 domain-containing protein [Isoptericola sp. b441]MDO8106050.1 DUF427 domain-containing protein [Isoptericola sp. b441]